MKCFVIFAATLTLVVSSSAELWINQRNKGVTLKPISACCDIPDLGDPKVLSQCTLKHQGLCVDVQCAFEKSGFLIDHQTLDKDAYKNHLRTWANNHKGWTVAVEKAISDCVEKDLRQYLDEPCRAYDVFTCTGIAMIKKCPEDAWKC